MERSRTKRYHYDQDYESENLHSRSKPRYGNYSHGGGGGGEGRHQYSSSYQRRPSAEGYGGGRSGIEPNLTMPTTYKLLCHDLKVGGVIGKSRSIIKSIRQHTGAWIEVHELIPGDEERIIEISDTRRRDSEGRSPAFSSAQEALLLVHDRILEIDMAEFGHNGSFGDVENRDYGGRGGGGGGGSKVVTRLVVSQGNVGCLMGKGGKIIEQMRNETRTQIRILPRDHTLPRCIATSEEIVQVVGNMNEVKHAMEIISSRLKESQHRDRSYFRPNYVDDFHTNSRSRRSSVEEPGFGSRSYADTRRNNYSSRSSGYVMESESPLTDDNGQYFPGYDIVFRILCPIEKVDCVVGKLDGIVELLQCQIGVNVGLADPVTGSNEHIIIISSDEGPEDELFPAQEALLHIQSRIVDIVPEKGNVITTRLLLQSDEVGCIGLNDATPEIGNIGGAKVEILPREELPSGVSETDNIVQIIGEIKAARKALMEVTSRIRSYVFREFLKNSAQAYHCWPVNGAVEPEAEAALNDKSTSILETQSGNDPVISGHQNPSTEAATEKKKDVVSPSIESVKHNETEQHEEQLSTLHSAPAPRISMPLVTRTTIEVAIPSFAVSLVTKSRKISLISSISEAAVKLIEDKPEGTDKTIQISGTPEQVEKAQSLLQGLILSAEEDEH